MDNIVNLVIGSPLGFLMRICLSMSGSYWISIVLFTLLTKVILFPLSLWVQKNSIKMVKIQPEINRLEAAYIYNKDAFYEEQLKVYKREKYNVFANFIPLLIQIPLIIGIINVIYNPMQHLLKIDNVMIGVINSVTVNTLQADSGSSPQLTAIRLMRDDENYLVYHDVLSTFYSEEEATDVMGKISGLDMDMFGMDLAAVPDLFDYSTLWLIPLLAGLSSLIMCVIQNKINVLQMEQGFWGKWGMVIFLTAFSLYFGFAVASGVGFYWIVGNVFSVAVMYILNVLYNPKKIIDYAALEDSKKILAEAKSGVPKKPVFYFMDRSEEGIRERQDYKRFFKVPDDKMRIVFYSKASGYYKYFKNIIEEILANSDAALIHYVTEDPKDVVFTLKNPRIIPYYISEMRVISLMMKLTCDVVVMTTPDLQTYHIKRSIVRKDIEYVYVDHAGTNLCMGYRPHALDYFDTIFAVSEEQALEVRGMEKYYGTPKKNILKCGYALIDDMIASYNPDNNKGNAVPTILIAPSWQEDNLLDSCIDKILEKLLNKDWKIILRPHPMYIKRFPDNMKRIITEYEEKFSDMFEIQTDFSSNSTVYDSDIVITDWSAIGTEFSFTTLKPTLFINTKMKVLNPDYEKIGVAPYDITVRNIVGKSIEKGEVTNIGSVISELLLKGESYRNEIEKERNRYYYNLGHSGEVGAKYILSRL